MLNIVPTNKCAMLQLSLTIIKRKLALLWKLETTAKGNFVIVSLLKQQGNSDFEFISVRFSGRYGRLYTLPIYSFVKIV